MNLTNMFHAKRDRYAKRQGDFALSGNVVRIGSALEAWNFVRALGGKNFRVLYVCRNGIVRDLIGRQGVYNSAQDGEVAGIGHAMASAERLTLSFWTCAYGDKVNTGAGHGYRTLRAESILAIRVDGVDILTDAGLRAVATGRVEV